MSASEFAMYITRFWQWSNELLERSPCAGSERAYHGIFTRDDPPQRRGDLVEPKGYVP